MYRWLRLAAPFFAATWLRVASAENPTFSLHLAAMNDDSVSSLPVSVKAAPGDLLTVDIRVRCWSNGTPLFPGHFDWVRRGAATLDYESFFNAPQSEGNVLPFRFAELTDPLGVCPQNPGGSPNQDAAFIDAGRRDYLFNLTTSFPTVRYSTCAYSFMISAFHAVEPPTPALLCPMGQNAYFGTVVLEVSPEAQSTFEVCLDDTSSAYSAPSYLERYVPLGYSGSRFITPLDFECLSIEVPIFSTHDGDGDQDSDLEDARILAACMTGPNAPPSPEFPTTRNQCLAAFNDDEDADVDLADWARFQNHYSFE